MNSIEFIFPHDTQIMFTFGQLQDLKKALTAANSELSARYVMFRSKQECVGLDDNAILVLIHTDNPVESEIKAITQVVEKAVFSYDCVPELHFQVKHLVTTFSKPATKRS